MTNNSSLTLLIILIIIILFFFVFKYTRKIRRFIARKNYFKMELGRATHTEKDFWRKKLAKEYLTLIPFAEVFFEKRKKRR